MSYNGVWRWHFYAGLFCIPFVLWLALTGSIYLWKPQIEALIDRPYEHVAPGTANRLPSAQVAAALKAVPGSVLHRYELPQSPTAAVRVIVGRAGEEVRVYVNPETLAVLKTVGEQDRLMRIVFRLHGELMMGDRGSWVVELAASWAIVMILTGLYLWWPRGQSGGAGIFWIRLSAGRRIFWRDLHAVIGLWVSFFALFLLVSGLPWASAWGDYFKTVRLATNTAVARQDWSNHAPPTDRGTRAMLSDHAEHGGMTMEHPLRDYRALDLIAAAVAQQQLAPPVLIAPPTHHGPWTAKSDAADRPLRSTLTLDGASGRVLSREDFGDRHWIDRAVGYGVAAHEGQLFGLANQLLGALTALGLMTMSVSGAVLWWRRRPEGVLGAPMPAGAMRFGWVLAALVLALGLMLPMMGASLLSVLAVERLVLRRLPGVGQWLGLRPTRLVAG